MGVSPMRRMGILPLPLLLQKTARTPTNKISKKKKKKKNTGETPVGRMGKMPMPHTAYHLLGLTLR